MHVTLPRDRIEQAGVVAEVLGNEVWDKFPLRDGVGAIHADNAELVLNRTWRPALSITGASGLPELGNAGNVMRASTAVKLSLRLPPTLDADQAVACLKELLLSDPPYNAKVTIDHIEGASGWAAPPVAEWLDKSLQSASETYFGKPAVYMGEGGSIPFMGMLGEKFPEAQFVITGVLGPYSNAHGPNEFLHLPTARKVTACMAHVLREHFARG
jgi:acetylornithine deacetylase/succinyl-diaminopimelate desuccinylase-like protein